MPVDSVEMLPSTVQWLNTLDIGDFSAVETPERMAWVARVLRCIPDDEGAFPHGKWATIQNIERQVDEAAQACASAVK